MVKRTKRYNRRRQKGGLFGFFEEKKNDGTNNATTTDTGYFSSFKMPEISNPLASDPSTTVTATTVTATTDPATTDSGYFSSIKMPEISNPFASSDPVAPVAPTPAPVAPTPALGGRRTKRMRGGIGSNRSLELTYYATPVNGIKVAEPTYMEYYKGGSRKKRRMRKSRKGPKCNKTCRKKHRHCRR